MSADPVTRLPDVDDVWALVENYADALANSKRVARSFGATENEVRDASEFVRATSDAVRAAIEQLHTAARPVSETATTTHALPPHFVFNPGDEDLEGWLTRFAHENGDADRLVAFTLADVDRLRGVVPEAVAPPSDDLRELTDWIEKTLLYGNGVRAPLEGVSRAKVLPLVARLQDWLALAASRQQGAATTEDRCATVQTDGQTYSRRCIHFPGHIGPCDFDIYDTQPARGDAGAPALDEEDVAEVRAYLSRVSQSRLARFERIVAARRSEGGAPALTDADVALVRQVAQTKEPRLHAVADWLSDLRIGPAEASRLSVIADERRDCGDFWGEDILRRVIRKTTGRRNGDQNNG